MLAPLHPTLALFRDQFPLLNNRVYLANCSQTPLADPVRDALAEGIRSWQEEGMDWERWMMEVERARQSFASLLGTSPANIAVGSSVSQLASSVASALVTAGPAQTPRRRILSSVMDFPGVAHAWLATHVYGWQVEMLEADESGLVSIERFAAASSPEVALLAAPHVVYTNGALLDLARLAELAHTHGSLLFVDAYQSIGTLPIDVEASDIDFLAAGALKYLCGTPGIAFLYVHPRVQERLQPTVTGWFGRQNPFAFEPRRLDYADNAARFDLGTPPILNAYVARAGIELVRAADPAAIRAHLLHLSTLAAERSAELGLTLSGPPAASARGATTAIDAGSPERAHQLESALRQRSIMVSARGRLLRLAPHGFTRAEEMIAALDAIADLQRTM